MPKTAQPAAPKRSAFDALETAETAVKDAHSVAQVLADLLIGQTDDGQISLHADGLFVLLRGIQDKCKAAAGALGDLRAAQQATLT